MRICAVILPSGSKSMKLSKSPVGVSCCLQYNEPGSRTGRKSPKVNPADSDAPPQLPAWMSEQLLQSLTSVLLELPFSRRAETEADLIGIKLMVGAESWLSSIWSMWDSYHQQLLYLCGLSCYGALLYHATIAIVIGHCVLIALIL